MSINCLSTIDLIGSIIFISFVPVQHNCFWSLKGWNYGRFRPVFVMNEGLNKNIEIQLTSNPKH